MRMRRYPGVKPFSSEERHIFFGRDREIIDITDLLSIEKIVILYSRSGYGKSSLINAGIIPSYVNKNGTEEEKTIPVVVRFGNYIEKTSSSPLINVIQTIENNLKIVYKESAFLKPYCNEKNLWYHLKMRQESNFTKIIFIFDQFEEFFTYPISDQEEFKANLAELIYSNIPDSLRKELPTFNKEQRTFIANPFEVKILISIRSDRMSLLDSMANKIPSILNKRYELKRMSASQAELAIISPAKEIGGNEFKFEAKPFHYSENAVKLALLKLMDSKTGQQNGVEAFQLQIFCSFLEEEVIKGKIANNQIETWHFEDKISDIFAGYYKRLLEQLGEKSHAATLLIEEGLLFENEVSGEIRRLSVDRDVLLTDYAMHGVTNDLLKQLENNFLVRREALASGGFNYEISHDILLEPIRTSRRIRRQKDLEDKNRKELENVKKIAREQGDKLKQERKRRYRAYLLSLSLGLFAIIAILTSILAWKQTQKAKYSERRATIQAQKAEKAHYKAEASKKRAHEALKISELNKKIADFEKAKALKSYQISRSALLALEKASLELSRKLIKEAQQNILNLDYHLAYSAMSAAASSRVNQDSTGFMLMELAWVYANTNKRDTAFQLIYKIANLFKNQEILTKLNSYKRFNISSEVLLSLLFFLDKKQYLSIEKKYYPDMVKINGGSFNMGCNIVGVINCQSESLPQHSVTVSSFYIARSETTVWQYNIYCIALGIDIRNNYKDVTWPISGDQPIINVSWQDAIHYANWLSSKLSLSPAYQIKTQILDIDFEVIMSSSSNGYRLPTEAEWEFTAREGESNNSNLFSGGNILKNFGWNSDNRVHKVMMKTPNKLQVFDLSGNVWEWCWDWFENYKNEKLVNPSGGTTGSTKVLRGGSYRDINPTCHIWVRRNEPPSYINRNIGFRLARSMPK